MNDYRSRWLILRRKMLASATRPSPRALAGAQTLASRILQRYKLHGLPRRGVGMQFLDARTRVGWPQALRLVLNLTQRIQQAARSALELRAVPAYGSSAALNLPGSQEAVLLDPARQPGMERLPFAGPQPGNRLLPGNHRRVELGSAEVVLRMQAQPATAGAELPLTFPVSMIARSLPPATPVTTSPANSSQTEASDHTGKPREMGAQAAERLGPGLPPAELRRVTEQVIQEIDKRIVANRERFGRT